MGAGPFWRGLGGAVAAIVIAFVVVNVWLQDALVAPAARAGDLPRVAAVPGINTTRIGSDDPIQTAVAVAQTIYPATEEENVPGAVVLVNRANLAEVLVGITRVQHFPVNAPILYVDVDSIPDATRNELLRLKPEGVATDGNVQVYLVGSIGDAVRREVEDLGYSTRIFNAPDPASLAEVVDTWTSTLHGDHENVVYLANLDALEPAIPAAFWNAHAGEGFAYVTSEGIPEPTRRLLERRGHGPWMYVMGDSSVVPDSIVEELGRYGQVTRIVGADAVQTSTFFAGFRDTGVDWGGTWWQSSRGTGWGNAEAGRNVIAVSIDGPGGWQNAVAATTLSHMGKHAPVVVVQPDDVPDPVASYLELLKPYPERPSRQIATHAWVVGGAETISPAVQSELDITLDGWLTWDEAS